MDPITAALNSRILSDEEKKVIADNLRRQEALGTLQNMSQVPGLSERGSMNEKNARALAKTLGESQYEMQRDLIGDEQKELERRATLAKTLGKGDKGEYWYAPTRIPGTDHFGRMEKYTGDWEALDGTLITPDDITMWQQEHNANKAAGTRGVTQAREEAKIGTKRLAEMEGQTAGMDNILSGVNTAIEAMDAEDYIIDGAATGPFWDYFPTLRESTSLFENAVSAMTLDSLSKYKLYPLSDKDIQVVRQATVPNLYPEDMKRWLKHKRASLEKIQQINRVYQSYEIKSMNETGRPLYMNPEMEAEAFDKADAIKGDFEFQFTMPRNQPPSEKRPEDKRKGPPPDPWADWENVTIEEVPGS